MTEVLSETQVDADATPLNGSAVSEAVSADVQKPRKRAGGKPGRSGPPGNANAVKHGLRMAVGRLPPGASYIRKLIAQCLKVYEEATLAKWGKISPFHAAILNTICECEKRRLLLNREYRLYGDDQGKQTRTKKAIGESNGAAIVATSTRQTGLSTSEKVSLLEAIGRACTQRNAAIEKLDLGDQTGSIYDALYGPVIPAHAAPPMPDLDQEADPPADAATTLPRDSVPTPKNPRDSSPQGSASRENGQAMSQKCDNRSNADA